VSTNTNPGTNPTATATAIATATATADAVVIGGGILGACTALHLAEGGAGKVVLLEREPALGTQTTHAGAGFVGYWAGELEGELARYGIEFYERLQAEAGEDLGVRHVGLLFPALSEPGVEMLREEYEREQEFATVELVDADEACRLSPLLAREAIYGGLYQPDGRQVPTRRVIHALAQRLNAAGVEVETGVEALRAQTSCGRVIGIRTSAGNIATGIIVNAAGAATRAVASRDGVDVAAVPLLESRVLTEPLAEVREGLPMLLFFERDLFYARTEDGGLLYGAIERELGASSRVPLAAPPGTGELPEHAAANHERLATELADVIPALKTARTRERASGLPTWTPDGRHILGPAPGLDGYVVLAGCNESGVTHGPGLARFAAELVLTGATEADLSPYRVDRFAADALDESELQRQAEAQYLARHPPEPGKAAAPFGITIPRSSH
jgi:glycine/D-amino acid oxidase-like deaminating enzyme